MMKKLDHLCSVDVQLVIRKIQEVFKCDVEVALEIFQKIFTPDTILEVRGTNTLSMCRVYYAIDSYDDLPLPKGDWGTILDLLSDLEFAVVSGLREDPKFTAIRLHTCKLLRGGGRSWENYEHRCRLAGEPPPVGYAEYLRLSWNEATARLVDQILRNQGLEGIKHFRDQLVTDARTGGELYHYHFKRLIDYLEG